MAALIAGTNKGMFLLDRNSSQWRPINTIVTEKIAGASGEDAQRRARRRQKCPQSWFARFWMRA